MICKKCRKTITDGSLYCNYCGKKQETAKRKVRRRASGTGAIYKDARYANPYIVRMPSTRYGGGRKYLGSYPTMVAAQAALENATRVSANDRYNYTLEQLYQEWSALHYETLTPSGIQGYTTAYTYINELYGCRFRELKTADFQACIDKCAAKFSRAQCEKVKQLCSQLCKYAMQNDLIDKNYAQFLKLPKQVKKEREIFTADDLQKLWEHSDDERAVIVLVLCYTGFRIGELFDIRKSNVNLFERYIVGGNKTEAGRNRTVPISPRIFDFVVKLYNSSTTDKLINKDPSNFRKREFYPLLKELGINSNLTPHCTRHTFATLGKDSGIEPEVLQKLLGHAKYETTADIYIHEDIDKLKQAVNQI